MPEPLPREMFYNDSEDIIRFKNSINIDLGICPIPMTWLPFFVQMSRQLTKLIKVSVKKKFLRRFDFLLEHENILYKGPRFYQGICGVSAMWTMDVYKGRLIKCHVDSYSYGVISLCQITGHVEGNYHIYVRWKSNLPGHEYIEPDDELELTENDITFEICTEIPEAVAQLFHKKHSEEISCSDWIRIMNDECNYPKRPKRSAKVGDFPFIIDPDCDFPDTSFTLYFSDAVKKETEEKIIDNLWDFLSYYNIKHINKIHSIMNLKDIPGDQDRINDDKVVQVCIDFGNCSAKAIKSVEKWLRTYDFGDVEKVVVK